MKKEHSENIKLLKDSYEKKQQEIIAFYEKKINNLEESLDKKNNQYLFEMNKMQENFSEKLKNANLENERKNQMVVADIKMKFKAKYEKKYEQFKKDVENAFDARLEISHKEIFEKIHTDYENELEQKELLINELSLKNKNLELSCVDNQKIIENLRTTLDNLEVNQKEQIDNKMKYSCSSLKITSEKECQSYVEKKDKEITAALENNEFLSIKQFYENGIENLGKKVEIALTSRDSLLKEKDLRIKYLENELDKIYSYLLLI